MEQNRAAPATQARPDALIAALLDTADEKASIVDRLMSLPAQTVESEVAVWDIAVARRLEAKLAERLRTVIEGTDKAA